MKLQSLLNNVSLTICSIGLALVLIWFGIFKFTPTEASGIEGLVRNSPLMSWLYRVFSVQTVSHIIGIIEIAGGAFLILGLFSSRAGVIGGTISTIIFFVTCTFLFSTPGMLTQIDGMWVPSDGGSFIIKDVVALGSSVYVLARSLSA